MSWSDPHEVPSTAAGERFVDYVKAHLIAVPVNEIGDAITGAGGSREPDILLDGRAVRTDHRLAAGQRITLLPSLEARLTAENRHTPPSEDVPLEVLHESDGLIVLNKPAGIHVHPVGRYRDATLLNALVHRAGARPGNPWGAWRPHPAHRLDRPVSGILVVAKSNEASGALNELQMRGELSRRYLVWVRGAITEESGTVRLPVGRDPEFDYRRGVVPVADGGQDAVTHWNLRERRPDRTCLEIDLETGRTHQIRVHMTAIGHRVCGDSLYLTPAGPSALRIALHSWKVSFTHASQRIELTAPPPPGFDEIDG